MVQEKVQYFSEFLAEHRRGELDAEITAALRDVVEQTQAVGDPKKHGELTVKVKVTCSSPQSPTVVLVDEVAVKVPQFARPSSVYYLDTHNGALTRNDPLQTRIPGTYDAAKGETDHGDD